MSILVHELPETHDRRAVDRDPESRDDLLARYLGALRRHGDPEPRRDELPEGLDVRTCARCGETGAFRLDPQGGWAYCISCERAA